MNSDNPPNILHSVRTLLAGAIDYAGLFPPAGLSMSEAVINYATYRNSNYNWMLGRFVVSAARLEEFYDKARDFISRDDGDVWRVAVVASESVHQNIGEVAAFNEKYGSEVVCDTLEIKAHTVSVVEDAVETMPAGVTAYFEVALDEHMPDMLATLATLGQRAKIRTGGLTPDAFPSSSEIIKFVRICSAANMRFKATAGLHHPIRCFRPLTYESDALSGSMHGFLNLFLMTGFAQEGFRPALLEDIMEEEFEDVFQFEDQIIRWRDDFELTPWQIERLRSRGIQSFGSCSFEEPIADLQKLGVL